MHRVDRWTVSCSKRCLPSIDVKGCITPAPISGQCSFHRENATLLCESWSRCEALNCNIFRTDCQARGRLDTVEHSFGDAYAYVYPGRHPSIGIERKAYHRRFDADYFVSDAMYVYNRFFARSTRPGVFVESGALDGSVYGSNTHYFERYLGWSGLLVEASSRNFNRLRIRRGGSSRVHSVHTALCPTDGWTTIPSSGGCCGETGKGDERVPCTSMRSLVHKYNVSQIDFWSLDVEGGEFGVLSGVDWGIPIYVILIESVTTQIRTLLKSRGFRKEAYQSKSRLNEIWVNVFIEQRNESSDILPFS